MDYFLQIPLDWDAAMTRLCAESRASAWRRSSGIPAGLFWSMKSAHILVKVVYT